MENRTPINMDYQRISSIGPERKANSAVLPIIFILVLVTGAAMAGIQIGKTRAQSALQEVDMGVEEPEPEVKEEKSSTGAPRSLYPPTETVQPVPDIWQSFTAPKTTSTRSFTINYPKEWTLESQPSIKLSKKSGVSFEIWLSAGSTKSCLFEEDKDKTDIPTSAINFPSFREVNKEGVMWRMAAVEKPNPWDYTFVLCEKKPGNTFYSQDTSIGYVPFKIPQSDTATINETIEILEKLEIN